MLEEDVLAGVEVVGGVAELVGDVDGGGVDAAIFDAGVAVAGYAQAEVEWTGVCGGEAEVGGEDEVAGGGGHLELYGSAVECEHEGLRVRCGLACGEVQLAGGADSDFSSAGEGNLSGVVFGGDGCAADEHCAAVGDLELA